MTEGIGFSIVIANYNYVNFVCRAIDSALSLRGVVVEVIVVDDGSTDDSRSVIENYGTRIITVFQDNAGQRVANNAGYAVSSGQIVVFLDADDVLDPEFGIEVLKVWRSGISKAQVQMCRVDENERPLGSIIPIMRHHDSPSRIREWLLATGEYPSPPGSGNAYARTYLDQIFPLGPECDAFTDSTCIAAAPIYGDVESIAKPLVLYRIHGSNDSNMASSDTVFGREVRRAMSRFDVIRTACVSNGHVPPGDAALFRGKHLLQLRAASLRLRPVDHPLPGDGRGRLLRDAIASLFWRDFEPARRRAMIAGWTILTTLAPSALARQLIAWRFAVHR